MTEKIDLLVVLEMPEYSRSHLAQNYEVHYWPDTATHHQRLDDPLLKKIRAVFKKGRFYLAPDEIAKVKRVRKTIPESAKPSVPEPAVKPPTPPRPQPPRRFGQRSSM